MLDMLVFILLVYMISNTTKDIIIIYMEYLRNKSWKPECVLSFNMDISISISILSRARGEGYNLLISANPC